MPAKYLTLYFKTYKLLNKFFSHLIEAKNLHNALKGLEQGLKRLVTPGDHLILSKIDPF